MADGSFRWFHDEGVLILDEQEAPKEIIGSWLDITERRNEQEMLRITQHTVDHNSMPIFWLEPYKKVKYANAAACNLIGCSLEEMQSKPFGFTHPDGTTAYWDKYLPLLKEKKTLELEAELRKKDGSTIPGCHYSRHILNL